MTINTVLVVCAFALYIWSFHVFFRRARRDGQADPTGFFRFLRRKEQEADSAAFFVAFGAHGILALRMDFLSCEHLTVHGLLAQGGFILMIVLAAAVFLRFCTYPLSWRQKHRMWRFPLLVCYIGWMLGFGSVIWTLAYQHAAR